MTALDAKPGLDFWHQERPVRPLRLGLSIGHPAGSCGTLGLFVRVRSTGNRALLTTATAIAPPGAEPGDFIHQPSCYEMELLTASTRVARLTQVAATREGSGGLGIDSAVAELLDHIKIAGNLVPNSTEGKMEPLAGYGETKPGEEVAKLGRSTGLTYGTVGTISVDGLKVIYGEGQEVTLNGVIEIQPLGDKPFSKPFSGAGDAGALVWRVMDRRAIGLVFAGDEQGKAWLIPIPRICETLELDLLEATEIEVSKRKTRLKSVPNRARLKQRATS